MEDAKRELLEQHGFDVKGTMKRFLNNDKLYKQCLDKFLADTSYTKLREAHESGDCESAFAAAHTMKGFVSNLGMNGLYNAVDPIVEKLRNKDMQISEELEALDAEYQSTCELIRSL